MNRFLLLLFFQLSFTLFISAQSGNDSAISTQTDSLRRRDTSKDSMPQVPVIDLTSQNSPSPKQDNLFQIRDISWQIVQHHPYFGFASPPIIIKTDKKQFQGKELEFYLLVVLLLLYALMRKTFLKYFDDLFRLFFRTTIKQKQLREQLIQTPLPSLLLNVFFVITGGLYTAFLLQTSKFSYVENFWLLSFYCMLALSIVYFIKFLTLKLSGWLFNMKDAAGSYIFIVFLTNKMIGLFLLPFLVLLAFAQGTIYTVSFTLSWITIVGLLAYRFILTYATVRNQVKVNPFHFFLYLCAFELAPLLLIYRGLLLFFHISA